MNFKKFSDIKKINEQEIVISKVEQPIEQPVQTEEKPVESTESTPVKLFSKIFESREMAHIYHLQVKGEEGSHAAHLALGSYYEGIFEYIDELIEVYSGQYDIVEGYDIIDTSSTKTKDKVEYFKEIAEYIIANRYVVLKEQDAHLQAIVDEIINLVYKTVYKLRFNK
jgi:hypothetical protein